MPTIYQNSYCPWVKIKIIRLLIFGNNLHFSGEKNHFNINLEDEVVRGSIILEKGKWLWPPPPSKAMPPQVAPKKPAEIAKEVPKEVDPFKQTLNSALVTTAGKIGCRQRIFEHTIKI